MNKTSELKKAYAFIEKQFHQYLRFYAWEVVWLVYTICMALSVGFIGAGMSLISSWNEVNVSEVTLFLLTGSLLWGYLSLIVPGIKDFTFGQEMAGDG